MSRPADGTRSVEPLDVSDFEAVIERFEEAWRSGTRPEIAAFLPDEPTVRHKLLTELIQIDWEYRLKAGDVVSEAEYRVRFPEQFAHSDTLSGKLSQAARQFAQRRSGSAPAKTSATSGLQPGAVLGNYMIVEPLGQGGMGQVFKATHRTMKRIVALKVIAPKSGWTTESQERFRREVETVARLSHPNIVTAHDADDVGGVHFLVMELVSGIDLSRLIREQGPLPIEVAVNYVLQAARGLEHAHAEGIIHRDIKPGNLIVNAKGVVKVLDLGLARWQTAPADIAADEHSLTQSGQVVGTVDYMSPEQALNTKYADARSDIYSLGCTLWFLLTGRPVYDGDSAMERLVAHREQPIPNVAVTLRVTKAERATNVEPHSTSIAHRGRDSATADPHAEREGYVERLDTLFQRMIAKKPDERLQTMAEVIAALESLLPRVATSETHFAPALASNSATVITRGTNTPGGVATPLDAAHVETAPSAISAEQATDIVSKPGTTAILKSRFRDRTGLVKWSVAASLIVLAVIGWRTWFGKDSSWKLPSTTSSNSKEIPVAADHPEDDGSLTWPPGPADQGLPGVVTRPATLPGIKRWQVTTVLPRSPVPSVSWSKQGLLAVGSLEGMVRVYDAQTMQLRQLLGPHDRQRNDVPEVRVAWNLQGTWLASVSRDGLRLWKADGTPGPVFDISYAYSAAWHPDGELVAVRDLAHVHFCRIDGTRGPVIDSHTECLAWSPAGSRLAVGGAPGKDGIRFWKQDGSADGEIPNVPGPTISLAWSPVEDRLVTGSGNGLVQIWKTDGTPGPVIAEASAGLGRIYDLQWSADGQHIAAATDAKGGQVWQPNGQSVASLQLPSGRYGYGSVSWSPDGQLLAVSASNGSSDFEIWGLELSGTRQSRHDTSHTSHPNRLASNADGKTLAVPDGLGRVRFWNPNGEQTSITKFTGDGILHQVQWHPQLADRMAWADATHAGFRLWSSLLKTRTDCTTSTSARSLAWSPSGDRVIASDYNGRVSLWSESGTKLKDIALPERAGRIAWSPKGDWLAGKIGGDVRLFQLDGSVSPLPNSSCQSAEALAFDPMGRWLAASVDGQGLLAAEQGIRVWPIPAGEPKVLTGHDTEPHSLSWHPTEPWLYSASHDGRVMKWDVTTGAARTFEMPNETFLAVDCSRVGAVLTARGWNNSLYRLDPVTLAPVWSAVLLNDDAYATFSPAGELLHGDATQVEKQLVYILDTEDGRRELLKSSEFQQRVAAAFKTRPGAKPKTKDPDRAAAEWVLSIGGTVWVEIGRELKTIAKKEELPTSQFQVRRIRVDGEAVTDEGLQHLSGLTTLDWLQLHDAPRVTREGMETLASIPNLEQLILDCRRFTDDDIRPLRVCRKLQLLSLGRFARGSDASVETLVQLPELKTLRPGNWSLTDQGLKRLLAAPKLDTLEFVGAKVTDDGIKLLADDPRWVSLSLEFPLTTQATENLGHLPNLKGLELTQATIPGQGFDPARFPKLRSLTVTNCRDDRPLTADHVARIARLKQLEGLSLTYLRCDEVPGLNELANLDHLKTLEIQAMPLTDDDLTHLAAIPALENLKLNQTKVTPAGLAKFKAARPDVQIETDIAEPKNAERAGAEWVLSVGGRVRVRIVGSGVLQEVTASGSLPKEPFVIEFLVLSQQADLPRDELRRLAGLSGLRELNLIGCPTFNDDDLLALRPALRRLKVIALVETAVTGAGLAAIQDSSDLNTLTLTGPQFTDAAMEHIATLPRIQLLDLSFTQITDRGLAKLSSQPDLLRLTLTSTRVTAAGIAELSKFRNLEFLGVGGIGLDVFEELGKLPKLERLGLDITQVTSQTMYALSKAPKLRRIDVGPANHTTISRSRIEPLARLSHLEELHLTAIALESTAWQQVAKLEGLNRLQCDDVTLVDDDLQQLVPLKSLKSLHFGNTKWHTKLTPAGLAKFKAARPDIKVESDIE